MIAIIMAASTVVPILNSPPMTSRKVEAHSKTGVDHPTSLFGSPSNHYCLPEGLRHVDQKKACARSRPRTRH